MLANDHQVGGDHYRKLGRDSYQHWDFVIDARLGYLEGVATKYLQRWRDKNGLEDLLKARHYIVKTIEAGTAQRIVAPARVWPALNATRIEAIGKFLPTVDGERERTAVALIANWAGTGDLQKALEEVEALIQEVKGTPESAEEATPGYVGQD